MNSKNRAPERRRHQRFSVVEGLIEPITLKFDGAGKNIREQPAILTNLSGGGMSLVVFAEPPSARKFEMFLTLPGLENLAIEGRVVRAGQKGQTWNVGIEFTRISRKDQDRINTMAQDHIDCETRIALNLPDACVPTCAFNALCMKPQKIPQYWKEPAKR